MNEPCPSILEGRDPEGRPFFFPCHGGLEHHGNHVYHGGKYGEFSFMITWSEFYRPEETKP